MRVVQPQELISKTGVKGRIRLATEEDIEMACKISDAAYTEGVTFGMQQLSIASTIAPKNNFSGQLSSVLADEHKMFTVLEERSRESVHVVVAFSVWRFPDESQMSFYRMGESSIWDASSDTVEAKSAEVHRDFILGGAGVVELERIAVLPDRQRCGWGTALVKHGKTIAGDAPIGVISSSEAVGFYEKLGYVKKGEFGISRDAIIFRDT